MAFDVNLITTQEDKDAILSEIDALEADYEFYKTRDERSLESLQGNIVSAQADVANLETSKANYEAVIPTLPAGSIKEDMENELVDITYKLHKAKLKAERYSLASQFKREVQLEQYTKTLTDLATLKTSVTAVTIS